jgi:hypothetical protein
MDSPDIAPKAPIEPALKALAERARQDLSGHLDADELVAYHERRLGEEQTASVRDHLALCAECGGLYLDLISFSAEEEAPCLTEGQIEDAWRSLAPRLAARPLPTRPQREPRRGRAVRHTLPWALAATLLLALTGQWVRIGDLRQQLEDQKNASLTVLHGVEASRGAGGSSAPKPQRVSLPGNLALDDTLIELGQYEYRIVPAEGGEEILSGKQNAQERGVVRIFLKRGSLPPGRYRLRLSKPGETTPVQQFPFEVVAPG